jgi:ankyrin repeat protein
MLKDIKVITELLDNGINPDTPSLALKTTPLHKAVRLGSIEIVKELLDFNADINIVESTDNPYTPLAASASEKNNAIFNLLIQFRADVNFTVRSNLYTPLVQSIMYDAFDLMETLLKSGANVNGSIEGDNETPLYEAVTKKDTKALEILLEYGADPNALDKRSPLIEAIVFGHANHMTLLIEKGAKVNEQYLDPYYNNDTTTPLFFVARRGNIKIVKILLQLGANPNIEVKNKKPIEMAIKKNRLDIAYLLRSYHAVADVAIIAKIVDLYGDDPYEISLLHIAAVKIKEHYELDTNPAIIDKLPLPSPLKKALKNYKI